MAKKVYQQAILKWALGLGLILGLPIFGYFTYSNQIGAITILEKNWTDYCNAISWDKGIVCEVNIKFKANEDTYWYPVNYDPYGRNIPYTFDPNVKEWKFERRWGNGWKSIPLDKPCTGSWCGKGTVPVLYSIKWKKEQVYETRITAIKNNPEDNIIWSFGKDDPIWFGILIEKIESCDYKYSTNEVKDYGICKESYVYENNITKINETKTKDIRCFTGSHTEEINNTICRTVGLQINDKKILWERDEWTCERDLFEITCDSQIQGNGDAICSSGESCMVYDIRSLFNPEINNFVKTSNTRVIEIE